MQNSKYTRKKIKDRQMMSEKEFDKKKIRFLSSRKFKKCVTGWMPFTANEIRKRLIRSPHLLIRTSALDVCNKRECNSRFSFMYLRKDRALRRMRANKTKFASVASNERWRQEVGMNKGQGE